MTHFSLSNGARLSGTDPGAHRDRSIPQWYESYDPNALPNAVVELPHFSSIGVRPHRGPLEHRSKNHEHRESRDERG